jgi:hypothetical protein
MVWVEAISLLVVLLPFLNQQLTRKKCSGKGSGQFEFLSADLAAVDRSVTPWVVVGGHRPMYWMLLQGLL